MDGPVWHFDDVDDEFLAAPDYPQPKPEHDEHDQITRNLLATFQHGIQTGLNGPIIGGQGVDG